MKPVTKEKALERMTSLCSRSEQCESDINRKLINWGLGAADRQEIITYLKENRFVDDARFARSYANDKSRFSHWGPYKIKIELVNRRIKASVINAALKAVPQQVWKDSLLKVALNKAKTLDLTGEDSFNESHKLFRYIVSRGFPSAVASKAVKIMKRRQEGEK